MRTIFLFSCMLLSAGFVFLCPGIHAQENQAQQVYLKAINIEGSNILRPSDITSQPGTVITWVNNSKFPKEILLDNREITHLCGILNGFFVNQNGQLESKKLLPNEAVNLCFIEKGKFEFTVRSSVFSQSNDEKPSKGSILIK